MSITPNATRPRRFHEPPVQYYAADGSSLGKSGSSDYSSTEKLLSGEHAIGLLKDRTAGDIGGAFYHYKVDVASNPYSANIVRPIAPNKGARVMGDYHVRNALGVQTWVNADTIADPDDTQMWADGSTAIARCKPDTRPDFSLADFLGQLHEGLPKIWGTSFFSEKANFFKRLGSEYLNHEFGWKPFVSDIVTCMNQIMQAHDNVLQYKSDVKKWHRRGYDFPDEVTVTRGTETTNTRPNGPVGIDSKWNGSGTGTIYRETTTTTKRWFRGAFVLPDVIHDEHANIFVKAYHNADQLLGVTLTPDVLWDLCPWSWVIDWFTNIGDVMSNITAFAFDGLVMPYGYQMQETTRESVYTLGYPNAFIDGSSYYGSMTITTVNQRRIVANPYGFGIDWDKLTPRQLALLASCGLSRTH